MMTAPEEVSETTENPLRSPKFWIAPVILVAIVMGLLSWIYMGALLNPQDNLRKFPIAIVNEDTGTALGPQTVNFGADVTSGLISKFPESEVNLQAMSWAEADQKLRDGSTYGAIVLPPDFSAATAALAEAAARGEQISKPTVTVYLNPRAGGIASDLAQAIVNFALEKANNAFGEQITATTNRQLAQGHGPDLSGPAAYVLSNPFTVQTVQHNPLPKDGSGFGLSTFYYSLLLVLAGFTGATIISSLVDGLLGFVPSEIGPKVSRRTRTGLTRFQTLLVKWGCVLLMAIVVSSLYIAVCTALGMPLPHTFLLWLFGILAITAVGVTCMSVMAIFGGIGMIINLLVFVVLDLPSSGGTVPLQAEPRFYEWLSYFEPMRQIFLGVNSIVYFDAIGAAGLTRAVVLTIVGLLLGVLLGLLVTRYYDRKGHTRAEPATA